MVCKIAAYGFIAVLSLCSAACRKTGTGVSPAEPEGAAAEKGPVQPTERSPAQLARDGELEKAAAFFIDLYTNHSPALSPDGKTLAFVSSREGISSVYSAPADDPAGAVTRISDTAERALAPRIAPDGKKILYVSDVGANEQFRIYAAEPGKPPQCLTPEGDLQRDPPVVTGDGSVMFFTAAELKETKTTLFRQALEPAEADAIVTLDSRAFLEDVSADGAAAILVKLVSFSDTALMSVDVKAGTMKQIYPPEGKKATVMAAALSADGKDVFVGTDSGGDSAFILKLDAKTGKQKALYQEIEQPRGVFDSLRVMAGGKKLLAVLDVGDHGELRVLDTKSMGLLETPEPPMGTVRPGLCKASQSICPVVISVPEKPEDVFLFDADKAGFTPARKETRAELEKLPKISVEIVQVPSTSGVSVPANVYLPQKLEPGKKLRVIVRMHGGPAGASQIRWDPMRLFYMSLGYAVIEPNVRGSMGFGRAWEMADNGKDRMKSVEDMGAVAQWAAARPWADPQGLVVMGGSYGGYMVLMGLAFQSDLWAAGVDIVGVSSLRTLISTTAGGIRQLAVEEFGDPATDGGFLDNLSPLTHANEIVDPLFVYQGENDPRVPRSQSDQIVGALQDRGIKVEYMIMAREGHSIDRRESKLEFLSRSARFLEEVFGLMPLNTEGGTP
jgi:dipeptidyl aminopeptidase/acylaminoacyl peptidase